MSEKPEYVESRFFDLVHKGRPEDLAAFLVQHPEVVNVQRQVDLGQTALVKCAYGPKLEIAEVLLQHGADVNGTDGHGRTPLMIAAAQGHEEMVIKLVDAHNADVHLRDGYGFFALQKAAGKGHAEIMRFLIRRGATVGQADYGGFTALHWAVMHGQKEAVRILLENGAPVFGATCYGDTPLSLAENPRYGDKSNYPGIVDMLQLPLTLGTVHDGIRRDIAVKPLKFRPRMGGS